MLDKLRDKQGPAPAPTPAAQPKRLPKKEYQAQQHKAFDQSQRLPDGAEFHLKYDGDKVEWSGWLVIGLTRFDATTSGAIQMLKHLDSLYRAHLAAQSALETAAPTG